MSKPKVLVIIDWFYPGFASGGPARSNWNMVNALKSQIDFDVITRNTDYKSQVPYGNIVSDEWTPLEEGIRVYYCSGIMSLLRGYNNAFAKKYQAVYINGIYSPLYSILPLLLTRIFGVKKTIVSPRGMLASSAIGVKKGKKSKFLFLMIKLGFYKGISFHATSQTEQQDIENMGITAGVKVVKNLPNKALWEKKNNPIASKREGELALVYLGRIAQEKNLYFLLKTLSHIHQGKITLKIIGTIYDQNYWEKCQWLIQKMPSNVHVHLLGYMDLNEVPLALGDMHFGVSPTLGENFGHAILELLLMGKPVIISENTPWRKLKTQRAGYDLPLKNDVWIDCIHKLLHLNQQDYAAMCEGARAYAIGEINIQQDKKSYLKMFNNEAK